MPLLLGADDPTVHVTDLVLLRVGDVPILTMHTLTLLVVTVLFLWFMLTAARQIATGPDHEGDERYTTKGRIGQLVEVITIYLRDEMLVPVLGEAHARRYLPYLMTLFFFILFLNLFGLVPLMDIWHLAHAAGIPGTDQPWIAGTATASITVTAALALIAFFVIQFHGFKELGFKGYLQHMTGGLVPGPIYLLPVVAIVFVVEVAGQFIKPAALAIRLFANMVAGHTLLAVLVGFGATAAKAGMGGFGIGGITLISGIAGIAITFLEIFVAFLQAFIFMFLTAVFISLLSHHEEHDHEHEPDEVPHDIEPSAARVTEPVVP